MWPFSKSDSLRTLARRVEELEAAMRSLKGEWLDTYERVQRLVGRIAKRDERAGEPPAGSSGTPAVSSVRLEVMKRRAPAPRGPASGNEGPETG